MPARASANSDGPRSTRPAPRADADPGDQQAAHGEGDGVEGEQPVGRHHEQQRGGQRRAEREPEVVERAEQAHRRGPPVTRRELREPGQRGGREQRGPDARRARRRRSCSSRLSPNSSSRKATQRIASPSSAHVRQPQRSTSAPTQRPEHDRREQVGQQHRHDRPGGAEAVVGEQRQRDVGEARAEARLGVGGEEAPALGVGERRPQHGSRRAPPPPRPARAGSAAGRSASRTPRGASTKAPVRISRSPTL